MENNFNKSQSDVINYRPDLKMDYIPSLNSTFEDKVNKHIGIVEEEDTRSVVLREFEENTPSSTLLEMDNMLGYILDYKSDLKNKLANTDIGKKYLSEVDEDKKQEIADENSNKVDGTTYLESLLEIEKIESEVKDVRQIYSNATYGEDVSYEKASNVDNSFINKLSVLEKENDTDSINYTDLYYENMISSIMKTYSFKMLDEGVGPIAGITDFCKSMPFNDKYSKILSNNFEKKQEILKNDICKDKKTAYNVRVALRNAFLAVQEYEDSLEAINSTNLLIDDYELALELKRDGMTSLSSALSDLTTATMYSTMSKGDIGSTLASKSNIRGYFIEGL